MRFCATCSKKLSNDRRKFCSFLCKKDFTDRNMMERLPDDLKKKCRVCGNPLDGKKRVFCGKECHDHHCAEIQRKAYASGARRIKKCLVCGSKFTPVWGSKICKNPECRKVVTVDPKAEKEAMLIPAKCPGCGVIHIKDMSPGGWVGRGTPRIGCSRYPQCVNTYRVLDVFYIASSFEYENQAGI